MNRLQRVKLFWVLFALVSLGVAAALVLRALRESIDLYYTPTQWQASGRTSEPVRIGGMVVAGSVERVSDSLKVCFRVTDFSAELPVCYEGILPDLFGEGQGAVVAGRVGSDGVLLAGQVLAKHDEEYRPPDIPAVPPSHHRRPQ